jgi:hypothetical protein
VCFKYGYVFTTFTTLPPYPGGEEGAGRVSGWNFGERGDGGMAENVVVEEINDEEYNCKGGREEGHIDEN